ncbi:hypothetical protein TPENAI_70137 [Tenacibaculum litopenaei]|uniref:hypothetical protein n=1 Tax=Tenacibaculum litopenaei TaxID=396016 RepID=UPI003893C071
MKTLHLGALVLVTLLIGCTAEQLPTEAKANEPAVSLVNKKNKKTPRGIVTVELEFGPVTEDGELEYSDKHLIKYNFEAPLESSSPTLKMVLAKDAKTKEEVQVVIHTGGVDTPPVQGLVITWPGYVFDNATNCYVYGYYSYDTDTGQSSFTTADLATQSTMNNCNYGDIA